MSNRRSRSSRQSGSSAISEDQIAELVQKLQQLIPEMRGRRNSDKIQPILEGLSIGIIYNLMVQLQNNILMSANRVLQETCNYIRNLHKEVDDLSDRLSELLASTDSDSAQAAIIRSLLM